MKLEHTATLRLHLWKLEDIGKSPAEVAREIEPPNAVAKAWIPQTIGDEIWLWYEFATTEERDEFLASLPERYRRINGFVADCFTQADLDHWANGDSQFLQDLSGIRVLTSDVVRAIRGNMEAL